MINFEQLHDALKQAERISNKSREVMEYLGSIEGLTAIKDLGDKAEVGSTEWNFVFHMYYFLRDLELVHGVREPKDGIEKVVAGKF